MSLHWGGRGAGHISRWSAATTGVPSLVLDFLTTTSLDSRITFSRTSQATLTDATGKLTYAPNNMLTNSESFEASSWAKQGSTVAANTTTAPDGTTTADSLIESATTAFHEVARSLTLAGTMTLSCYLKANTRTFGALRTYDATNGSRYAVFNLSAGTAGVTSTNTTSTITAVGNGWYRCSMTYTFVSASADAGVSVQNSNAYAAYAGDGTSGIYVWGAQLEQVTYQTTPGTYNSTTPKNLLGYTQEFDNAAWTKGNATVTANAIAAPDGTLSADKLVEDTAASTSHRTWQAPTTAAAAHTFSVYLKAAERSFALIYAGVTNVGVMVNLSTGTTNAVAGITAPTFSSVTDVGNGWYRCAMTFTTTAAANSVFVYLANNSTSFSYTGDGTSGIYVWGAQLSNSASVDAYSYNPGAAPTSAAYYGPRFDYDPVTLAPKGLLIEEQRSNLLTYSEQFDNAAWTKLRATVTANATTPPDGTTNADQLLDTAVAGTHVAIKTITKAASAITYAATVFAKQSTLTKGELRFSDQAGNGVRCTFDVAAGTVGSAAAFGTGFTASSSAITALSNGWYRITLIGTTNTATTLGHEVYLADATGNTSYTGTGTGGLFVWGAQLEAGAFATSYIPTVASQATRTADVATMTGANFSSWYNQSAGTVVAEFDYFAAGDTVNAKAIFAATDGTSNNRVYGSVNTASEPYVFVATGGVAQANIGTGVTVANNAVAKLAAAYKANDFAGSTNGAAVVTDTSGTVPAVDRLGIGNSNNFNQINGHIRSLAYYNTRLLNSQLQTITT